LRKPYAESSEQNQAPILAVLREILAQSRRVLELGSGTGQHAVHFGRHLPHLRWLPSDLAENLPGIRLWLAEAALPNVEPPLALDVNDPIWPVGPMGVRNFEDLDALARESGLTLQRDYPMPVNNRTLVWVKTGP
jgi:hypothetical protein